MGIRMDASRAEQKIDRLTRDIRAFGRSVTRREAYRLQKRLKRALPHRTGFLRESVEVTRMPKATAYQVRIRKRRYPKFFYAIMFMAIIRRVVVRNRRSIIARIKAGLRSVIRRAA